MPRTPASYTNLTPNNATVPVTNAVDVANGLILSIQPGLNSKSEWLVLVVSNTDAAARTFTLQAGDPTLGLGSYSPLVISIPAGTTRYIGPFESARYTQRDGSLWLDFSTGFTGTVTALMHPRGV